MAFPARARDLCTAARDVRGKRSGFTLIEFLIYAGIFSITILVFVAILIALINIEAKQGSIFEVNQQAQFLLQTFQRYIEESSAIHYPPYGITDRYLLLRHASSARDLTLICLGEDPRCAPGNATDTVYIATSSEIWSPLTSPRVKVTSLAFTRYQNSLGHDSISIAFDIAFNANTPQRSFSRTVQVSVARAGPALFYDDVAPPSGNSGLLGDDTHRWASINDIIYLNRASSAVGIGVVHPIQQLEVNGGVKIGLTASADVPNGGCAATSRGTLWFNDSDSPPAIWLCVNQNGGDIGGPYAWVRIHP